MNDYPTARQEYVLGFGFSAQMERVVLIRKNKPAWQRGKLNGIGGKIEDESKYTAMVREFKEECGCQTHGEQWSYFCRMEGNDFAVHCFATVVDPTACRTTEAEKVELITVSEIKNLQNQMVENLPWLIHLAFDHLQDSRPFFVVAAYARPEPNVAIKALKAQAIEATNSPKEIEQRCLRAELEAKEQKEENEELSKSMCEMEDWLLGTRATDGAWDCGQRLKERIRDLIAKEGEVCDLREGLQKAEQERDEAMAENARLREALEKIEKTLKVQNRLADEIDRLQKGQS